MNNIRSINTSYSCYTFLAKVLCIILFILISLSCKIDRNSNLTSDVKLRGTLIFAESGFILKLNLQSKVIDTILSREMIQRIVKVSNDDFVIEAPCGISSFNIRTGSMKFIHRGCNLFYFEKHKKIFYYDETGEGEVFGLYMASIDSLNQPHLIFKAPKGIRFTTYLVPPVQISDDEIICIGGDKMQEDLKLWIYNIRNNVLTPTGISGKYSPVCWIGSQNILLCKPNNLSDDIYEIDLRTKMIEKSTVLNHISYMIYINKYDVIIYSKIFPGMLGELSETYDDLHVYSFKENKEFRYIPNICMDSAIFIDE